MSSPLPNHRSIYADDALMQPLIAEFVGRLPAQVAEIRRAMQANDGEALRKVCHQLKGSGRSFGFGPISEHAATADEKLRAGLPVLAVKNNIAALLQYIESIENYRPL